MENIQVGAGQLGIFTDTFTTICGNFSWKYQLANLIWDIGHFLSLQHITPLFQDLVLRILII